jgi:adenosylhomocysteine nucleosidase
MIAIIGAMDEEVAAIKKEINQLKENVIANIRFFEGTIHQKAVVLLQSGIGKVNASVSTTILFEHYPIEYVINIGTAGGIKQDCEVLDLVISTQVAYHDVNVTAFNYEWGQVPQLPLYFKSDSSLIDKAIPLLENDGVSYHLGLIVSGDQFIQNETQTHAIKAHFNEAVAVEMEAAAIAHVCHLYQKPFIIMRSLSDIAGKASNVSFDEYLEQASIQSSRLVKQLII